MRLTRHRRWAVPVVAAAAVGLALTACTGDIANETAADVDCGPYEEYGTFDGAEVTVAGTILDLEADRLNESWADFETCTGISVEYQGSKRFKLLTSKSVSPIRFGRLIEQQPEWVWTAVEPLELGTTASGAPTIPGRLER